MESSLKRARHALLQGLAGALAGGVAAAALIPYLRQMDPLGLSAIGLISLIGVTSLGCYVRGRT
jgi:hypothetical protein